MTEGQGDHEAGEAGFVTETINLTTVMLGLEPYMLVRIMPGSDGSGGPALHIEAGGGVEDNPMELALLVVTEVPAEKSMVAQMLRELAESGRHDPDTLHAVTVQFNPDWLSYVFDPA